LAQGATTFSITTLSAMTFLIRDLFFDTEHK
jgi:hypothetical protein